ncbi:MAG TPA: sigma-70 family RNA polymerase sigma factor [Bacteroidales bacterium]
MKTGTYNDIEILRGIQLQDSKVLLFVYHKNFRSVLYFIKKNRGTDKDAEDVFQDAMIVIYNKVSEGSLNLKCSLRTYLFSVAKILWLKELGLRGKNKFVIDDCDNFINENDGILEDIVDTERKSIFLKHYNELTEDCQKIIKYFLRGVSISEITKVMGYSSEQHTKNRRFRCKKTLIEKILQNPHYKELANGTIGENYQIPRW